MKTFKFVGVLVLLALVVGCPNGLRHDGPYSQYELKQMILEDNFEKNFGVKWPQTADERELLRSVVVEKMCSAWNEIADQCQKLEELEEQIQEWSSGKLTPKDVTKRASLIAQKRELEGTLFTPRGYYHSTTENAYNAGFQDEAWAMPDNGLPNGGDDCW